MKIVTTSHFSVRYDEESQIVFVTYGEKLTPDITAEVYKHAAKAIELIGGIEQLRGSVYDFRKVKVFNQGNLATARNQSQSLNAKHDMSHIAVALLVDTLYQEQMVSISLKTSPQQERKRIVRSMEAAIAFIDLFKAKSTTAQIK